MRVSSLGKVKVRALETGAFQSVANLSRLLHHKHVNPIFLLSQEAVSDKKLSQCRNVLSFHNLLPHCHVPFMFSDTSYYSINGLCFLQSPSFNRRYESQEIRPKSKTVHWNRLKAHVWRLICLSFLSPWVYIIRFRFSSTFSFNL